MSSGSEDRLEMRRMAQERNYPSPILGVDLVWEWQEHPRERNLERKMFREEEEGSSSPVLPNLSERVLSSPRSRN